MYSRYLRNLELFSALARLFGSLRKSEKGLPIPVLFHQLFCFFLDGTDFSLVRFDDRKESEGSCLAISLYRPCLPNKAAEGTKVGVGLWLSEGGVSRGPVAVAILAI